MQSFYAVTNISALKTKITFFIHYRLAKSNKTKKKFIGVIASWFAFHSLSFLFFFINETNNCSTIVIISPHRTLQIGRDLRNRANKILTAQRVITDFIIIKIRTETLTSHGYRKTGCSVRYRKKWRKRKRMRLFR